jgi:hypothetical protein
MEPRSAGKRRRTWIAQGERGGAVGEHGSFTVRFNNHHNAGAATPMLQKWFNARTNQCGLKGIGGGILANRPDEARCAPRRNGGYRNICGTAATSSGDLGGGIGAAAPWGIQPHGDLVDEVAHTDDQRA